MAEHDTAHKMKGGQSWKRWHIDSFTRRRTTTRAAQIYYTAARRRRQAAACRKTAQMERKEIIDRINALNHEQLETLLALMQDEERKEKIIDELVTRELFEGFKALKQDMDNGYVINVQPACDFYGCTPRSMTATLYAGFAGGYCAGVCDMMDAVEKGAKGNEL